MMYVLLCRYDLNTQSGILIQRHGVLSLTTLNSKASGATGSDLKGLICVTTEKRWRGGQQTTIKTVADYFRVYKLNTGVFAGA